jgi:hypothetical protein
MSEKSKLNSTASFFMGFMTGALVITAVLGAVFVPKIVRLNALDSKTIAVQNRTIAEVKNDASLDTVIFETVSSPSEVQSAAKVLSAFSLTPQGKILVGLLSAAGPANKQIVARWVVPGKVRPMFLGANPQATEFLWVDAQTGAQRSQLEYPAVPNQGGN